MSVVEILNHQKIQSSAPLITPCQVKAQIPLTQAAEDTVLRGRDAIANILDSQDSRLLVIVGPCSIHDPNAALEYAERLKGLSDRVADKILLIMRVYFEKPRTTIGWKGLINDPDLDGSFNVEKGLLTARQLLLKIAEIGVPVATEALDPVTPQYLSELIAWTAIGARTTESQTHREMASGLSMPVGFKNSTDGNIQIALDAILSARIPHRYLGINQAGQVCTFNTVGNPYGHLILRGGDRPNYDAATVAYVERKLQKLGLPQKLIIDCSHGNSNKNHKLQSEVFNNILEQIDRGNRTIFGVILESNLYEGNQTIPLDTTKLNYGVSVTDKCISWEETENLLLSAYGRIVANRKVTMQTCGLVLSGIPISKRLESDIKS
jgi:3-deoxy-7-phosphoheptulonate synthase